ncbi:hypothetical protein EV368DRAFT_89430 [Lentinula lateritia]|nr:hypothetical protein EV368DRAFT_89430 [Lentinula lateritia]
MTRTTQVPTPPNGPQPRRTVKLTEHGKEWREGIRRRDKLLQERHVNDGLTPTRDTQLDLDIVGCSLACQILEDNFDCIEDDSEIFFAALANIPSPFNPIKSNSTSTSKPRIFDLKKAPSTCREMLLRPDKDEWITAEDKEISGLFDLGVFEEVPICPKGKLPIGLKMVYDLKMDGTKKARLVAQGFTQ